MDISIIIPCHNSEKFIKPLLLSFQALNLNEIEAEFIFVLDNCTDNTKLMIQQYMDLFNYTLLECTVKAPGLARNLGLRYAKGEYIWFVDSDDWIINPEVLQQALPAFNDPNCNMIQLKFVSNFFTKEHYSMVWQYIYRYSFIINFRFNDKQNLEDNDFSKEVIKANPQKNFPLLKIPSYFYNYRRPGSLTSKLRENLKVKI